MKRIIVIALLLFIPLASVLSQNKRDKTKPVSLTYKSQEIELKQIQELSLIKMPVFDIDSIKAEINDSNRFAFGIPVDIDILEKGVWDTLDDGSRICRLLIVSDEAKSLHFIFKKFILSEGCKLWIYDPSVKSQLGPFNETNNKKHHRHSTSLLLGDTAIYEYYEPKEQSGNSNIILEMVIHGYKDVNRSKSIVRSWSQNEKYDKIQLNPTYSEDISCEVAHEWCMEKFSICRILYGPSLTDWGTGTIMNSQTGGQSKPNYLLTSWLQVDLNRDWAISEPEKSLCGDMVFDFGYFELECESQNPTLNDYITKSGAEFLSADVNSQIALLELLDPVYDDDNVYYSGWEYSDPEEEGNPSIVYILHHPDFEDMQFAVHDPNYSIIKDEWELNPEWGESFWRIKPYNNLSHITNGSQGAPYYNSFHRIIGVEYGNNSVHYSKVRIHWGGRFSVAWLGGGTPETQLKHWLAPNSTGDISIDGSWNGGELNLYGLIHDPDDDRTEYWGTPPEEWTYFNVNRINTGTAKIPLSGNYYEARPFKVKYYPDLGWEGKVTLVSTKEIRMLPCSYVYEGSEFHAYLDCSAKPIAEGKPWEHFPNQCEADSAYYDPNPPKYGDYSPALDSRQNVTEVLSAKPNPFTNETTISYRVRNAGYVKLEIVDLLGISVVSLINEPNHRAGLSKAVFDAKGLPPGVYFCILKTNEISKTIKLIIER